MLLPPPSHRSWFCAIAQVDLEVTLYSRLAAGVSNLPVSATWGLGRWFLFFVFFCHSGPGSKWFPSDIKSWLGLQEKKEEWPFGCSRGGLAFRQKGFHQLRCSKLLCHLVSHPPLCCYDKNPKVNAVKGRKGLFWLAALGVVLGPAVWTCGGIIHLGENTQWKRPLPVMRTKKQWTGEIGGGRTHYAPWPNFLL